MMETQKGCSADLFLALQDADCTLLSVQNALQHAVPPHQASMLCLQSGCCSLLLCYLLLQLLLVCLHQPTDVKMAFNKDCCLLLPS